MTIHTLMKGLLGSFTLMALGSCAVYKDPVHLTYVDAGLHMGPEVGGNYTVHTEPDEPVNLDPKRMAALGALAASAPTAPQTVETQKITVEVCERFKFPVLGPIPRLSQIQIENIATGTSSSAVPQLIDKLEEIYKYAHNEEVVLAAAYARYNKSCRKMTFDKPVDKTN